VKKFVCGDPKYSYYHEQIKGIIQPTKTKTTIATLICTAIHGVLGISTAVIYPAVILLLASIAAIGIMHIVD
jgi:hypothetical protein